MSLGKEGVASQINLAFLWGHHKNSVCSFFTVIGITETNIKDDCIIGLCHMINSAKMHSYKPGLSMLICASKKKIISPSSTICSHLANFKCFFSFQ